MSAPRHLRNALELLAELVQRSPFRKTGPVRVEAPLVDLENVRSPAARSLSDAAFIDPELKRSDELPRALALAKAGDHYLDLKLDFVPNLDAIMETARIARIQVRWPSLEHILHKSSTAALVRAASRLSGALVSEVPIGSVEDLERFHRWLEACPPSEHRLAIRVVPNPTTLPHATQRFESLAVAARRARITLEVLDVGTVHAAPPADPFAGFSVLAEAYRALFRSRPSLCPMPFLMLRFGPASEVRACPNPEGPLVGEDEAPFHSAAAVALRATHWNGNLDPACQRCALLPRIRHSLLDRDAAPSGAGDARAFTV